MSDGETVTLWRPVGPEELRLIQEAGMRAFQPRLPEQPIFYPVLSEDYAIKIARDWNVPASGSGYVTRFRSGAIFSTPIRCRRPAAAAISNTGSRPRTCPPSTPPSSARSR